MKVSLGKFALAGLVAAALALMMTPSASARDIHYLSSTFGSGELSLEKRSGVVYDKETEEIYVADTGHDRIARYGADGKPLGALATPSEPTFLALDNSSGGSGGDLYVVEGSEAILKLDPSGAPVSFWGTGGRIEGFGEIAGIAVDPSGNLFVLGADFGLHELSPSGSETSQCAAPYQEGADQGKPVANKVNQSGIAVDGEDNLYIGILEKGFSEFQPHVAKITSECGKVSLGEPYHATSSVNEADNSVFISNSEPQAGMQHISAKGEAIGEGFATNEGIVLGSEGKFGRGEGEGGVGQIGQLTVRSADEAVYVNDIAKNDVAAYTVGNVEPPEVELFPASEATTSTVHLRATINPGAPAGNPPAFNVRYEFGCFNLTLEENAQGCRLSGKVPAGSEPVTVEGTAEGLEAASEYAVYMRVSNAAYSGTQVPAKPQESTIRFQTGAIAPSIGGEAVTEASESSASIGATINPHGAETGYRVEYVARAQFEASGFAAATKTPEQQLPAGVRGVPVAVTLSGLPGSSSYVARVVAANTIEGSLETVFGEPLGFMTREPPLSLPGGCANEVFRSGASAALPDCRAYEQSTPIAKNGGGPAAVPGMVQATEDPNGITFYSQSGVPGGVGAQDYPSFLSSRGEGSWGTQGLLPAAALGTSGDYLGLSAGGRYAITEASGRDENGEFRGTAVFEKDLISGQTTTIVPYDKEECHGQCFALAGASADGSMVYLETSLALTQGQAGEETPAGQRNVFLWERGSGRISLVDVGENGAPLPEGGFAGPYWWAVGEGVSGTDHGGAKDQLYTGAINAISRDGSQIVYTERGKADEEGESNDRGQLYVRHGLGGPAPQSAKASAYRVAREEPEFPAAFLEATPDGRYVFFKSRAQLTSDAYSGEGSDSLYRYDVSTDTLIDVTSEKKVKFQAGPGVIGMLGASETGQAAYFVATTILTTTPGPEGKTAEAGGANVYRWQEGAKSPISFVATLDAGFLNQYTSNDAANWSPAIEYNAAEYPKAARVSADGDAVVFSSRRALTGAENHNRVCSINGALGAAATRCAEIFRYSASTGKLDCVSCDPTGVQPLGSASIGTPFIDAEDLPSVYPAPNLPRNLSADGDRVFFQTPDPLIAADVNAAAGCRVDAGENKATCMDVYEWEAPGAGSCPQATASAKSGGCLYLISSGRSEEASYFADADREGRNVYFFTASQLLPSDRDQIYDIYDASEGGGLASQHQVPVVPCGSRQACQGPQVTPQAGTSPGSSSLVTSGNPKAKPHKKKKARKHRRGHRKQGHNRGGKR